MKQILNVFYKDGSERQIKCSWFTFTTSHTLVVAYKNDATDNVHNEIIEMDEIDYFGGNPSYENK